MYPLKNSTRNARLANFPVTPLAFIKFVLVCLITASVPYALYVRVDSKASPTSVTVPDGATVT